MQISNLKNKYWGFFFVTFLGMGFFAQTGFSWTHTVRVYGMVIDKDSTGLYQANVSFISQPHGDTTSTQTDTLGAYSLQLALTQTGVKEDKPTTPERFQLYQNYPNPFNPGTVIEFELPQTFDVKLTVFNIKGQVVRVLADGFYPAGLSRVRWDGTNNKGIGASTGIYFYRLETKDFTKIRKMVLLDGAAGRTGKTGRIYQSPLKSLLKSQTQFQQTFTTYAEKEGFLPFVEENFIVSSEDTVIEKNILLEKLGNPPISDAGFDQTVKVGNYVVLDGSGSSPGDAEAIAWYQWDQDENNPAMVDLSSCQTCSTRTIGLTVEGVYRFTLTVYSTDQPGLEPPEIYDESKSEPDEVIITVIPRDTIVFEDPKLEVIVRYTLKMPTENFTETALLSLDTLIYFDYWHQGIWVGQIESLNGLENCMNLQRMDFQYHLFSDLSPLANLTNLIELNLSFNQNICDISPLVKLIQLKYLYLNANGITDISPLANMTQLIVLELYFNPIENINAVESMTNLEVLTLNGLQSGDISPLAELRQLYRLVLRSCQITDITSLTNLSNLNSLTLSDNSITDISSLAGLINLNDIRLNDNQIVDISALENLTELTILQLYDNNITDILPLVNNSGLGEGDSVYLSGNPLSETSINVYIPALRERGVLVVW
ncbi:MAG TPA: hypothetical protein DHW42_07850 [Candidatus Marinimicrobia bacterium]|nr:hypothetical protein [Candidatus Neomarinimicrobiota bacterium]